MKKWLHIGPGLFFLLFIQQVILAQDINSMEYYLSARRFYEEGRLDTTISLLSACIHNRGFTRQLSKADQLEVYRLMAQSFYLDYQPEKAKFYVKKVLQLNPEYHMNFRDDDISEFRAEVSNQDVLPVYQIVAYGGYGLSSIATIGANQYMFETTGDTPDLYSKKDYRGKGGFHIGFGMEQAIAKKWRIVLNYEYSRVNYSFSEDYQIYNENYTFDYNQMNGYEGLQLYTKYYLVTDARKNISPYLFGGIYILQIINATRRFDGNEFFVNKLMNRYNYGYLFGTGISLRNIVFNIQSGHPFAIMAQIFNGSNLNLELKYLGSIRNFNDVNQSYDFSSSNTYLFQYYHVPDNISIRQFVISFGISWPLNYGAYDK